MFWDSGFPFRRLDKKIYREFADARKEKKHVQRDKNGNSNNVEFYAILAHPSHMQFLLKSQNTKVTNTQLKISYSQEVSLKYISDVVTLGTFCYRDQSFINRRGRGQLFFSRKERTEPDPPHTQSKQKNF